MIQHSSLLNLPAEIRNDIYRYALVLNHPISVIKERIRGKTALLQTCTQIRKEATHFFFTENAFRILPSCNNCRRAIKWLRTLEGEKAHAITKLIVEFRPSRAYVAIVEAMPHRTITQVEWDEMARMKREHETEMKLKARDIVKFIASGCAEGNIELVNPDCSKPYTWTTTEGSITGALHKVCIQRLADLLQRERKLYE